MQFVLLKQASLQPCKSSTVGPPRFGHSLSEKSFWDDDQLPEKMTISFWLFLAMFEWQKNSQNSRSAETNCFRKYLRWVIFLLYKGIFFMFLNPNPKNSNGRNWSKFQKNDPSRACLHKLFVCSPFFSLKPTHITIVLKGVYHEMSKLTKTDYFQSVLLPCG